VLRTLRLFSAVSLLRANRDVAQVSVSKSDTALYCHLLPHAHISSTKFTSRNYKETGQIVPWLPCRPAGDLASLELGQDFHSGRDITDRPLSRSFLKKRGKLFSHTCAAEQCNHIPCVDGG